ncbi:MAG: substrate-binding domain-containing protein [Alphaproteobacteria bacterium]|nr:substrate-binding domain-containing protein [Alphaproteobacteria bacterium]
MSKSFGLRVSALALVAAAGLAAANVAAAESKRIGVSWRHFQEERWKIDEAGIQSVLGPSGYEYVSTDAQADPVKQLADVESLIATGVDALIVLAQDSQAILPVLETAHDAGIPVVAYDAPVDDPKSVFVSFDNVAVGRLMAEAMVAAQPDGNWALIEGDSAHSIVNVFREGQMQVLQPLIDSGKITIVGQQNIENWRPDGAQAAVDQILTANDNNVQAVLAMNDGMSGGAAAALEAQGLSNVALSGQDGETAALNRIAKGEQTVTIWKNATNLGQAAATAAIALAEGSTPASLSDVVMAKTQSGKDQPAILLEPIAVTAANLNLVLDANWISKEALCAGVSGGGAAACN